MPSENGEGATPRRSRIACIRWYWLQCPLPEPILWHTVRQHRVDQLLVQVVSEDGAEGWGECSGPPDLIAPIIESYYAPLLLGQDALQYATHWERLYFSLLQWARRGISLSALSGLDIALWDLAGHILGRSLSALMGGSTRERLPCYATGFYFRDLPETEVIPAIVDEALGLVEEGFRGVKVQMGRNLAADAALARSLRNALPQTPLAVDCSCAYDLPEAIQVGRILEGLGFAWIEDPISPDHYVQYRQLGQYINIPLMAGEWEQTRWDFQRLLDAGGVALPSIKLTYSGGITEALRIRAVAQSHGFHLQPIAAGTWLDVAACAHFLASDYRRPGGATSSSQLGYPAPHFPLRTNLWTPALRPEGGMLAVPTGPGLGLTINADVLKSLTVHSGEVAL